MRNITIYKLIVFEWIYFQSCFNIRSRDRDHLAIFFQVITSRSQKKIADHIADRAIADLLCLGISTWVLSPPLTTVHCMARARFEASSSGRISVSLIHYLGAQSWGIYGYFINNKSGLWLQTGPPNVTTTHNLHEADETYHRFSTFKTQLGQKLLLFSFHPTNHIDNTGWCTLIQTYFKTINEI